MSSPPAAHARSRVAKVEDVLAPPGARAASRQQRLAHVRALLDREDLSAIVCALPSNVLLLSGYWPVVGTACAVVWREGPVLVITPADERELAERGWADEVQVLEEDGGRAESLSHAIGSAASRWGGDRIGVERGPSLQTASYVAMCEYGASFVDIVGEAWPHATLLEADDLLAEARSVATPAELHMVSAACTIAGQAFRQAVRIIHPGASEMQAAAQIRACLGGQMLNVEDRADGYVFCMSGPRSAKAYGAYAQSTGRTILDGDLVLVHCNAYVNGYWTDVTRTYCVGQPDGRQCAMYAAVFAAREAALGAIHPGVPARDVDEAARRSLSDAGFGNAFKHSTGHGVGFSAIDHEARPRVAPASRDTLEYGMVFNVEPAIYLEGYGGIRHCDVVAVTRDGYELLTPFQTFPVDLVVNG